MKKNEKFNNIINSEIKLLILFYILKIKLK